MLRRFTPTSSLPTASALSSSWSLSCFISTTLRRITSTGVGNQGSGKNSSWTTIKSAALHDGIQFKTLSELDGTKISTQGHSDRHEKEGLDLGSTQVQETHPLRDVIDSTTESSASSNNAEISEASSPQSSSTLERRLPWLHKLIVKSGKTVTISEAAIIKFMELDIKEDNFHSVTDRELKLLGVAAEDRKILLEIISKMPSPPQRDEAVEKYKSLVTSDSNTGRSIRTLRPGSAFRHAQTFGHTMRGRGQLVRALEFAIARFYLDLRDDLVLFILTSMPRQGKTFFLDNIAYNRKLLLSLSSTDDPSALDEGRIFVVNVTFNSRWDVPKECNFDEACQIVCIRLLAAAIGIFKADDAGEHLDLLKHVSQAHKNDIYDVWTFITKRIKEIVQTEKKCYFLLLFDEFTNVAAAMKKHYGPGNEVEEKSLELNSKITRLISATTVVILSGFNHIRSQLSKSGRRRFPIVLAPSTTAEQRRKLHVMKTQYFQGLGLIFAMDGARNDALYTVIAIYELVKASPGLFGAVLERLLNGRLATIVSFLDQLEQIPFFGKRETENIPSLFQNILVLKSVQFAANESGQSSCHLQEIINSTLEEAEEQAIVQLPMGPDGLLSRTSLKPLQQSRIEPYFMSGSRLDLKDLSPLLSLYFDMLKNFARRFTQATVDPATGNVEFPQSDYATRFSMFSMLGEVETKPSLKTGENRPQRFFSGAAGSFFEDATVLGILIGREMRSRAALLAKKNNISNFRISSRLDQFLPEAKTAIVGTPPKAIEWSCDHLTEEDAVDQGRTLSKMLKQVVQFSGHYPTWLGDKDGYQQQHEAKGFPLVDPTKHFNTKTVLIARRPENNPKSDVTFGEKTTEDEPVQFWIDTKLRTDEVLFEFKLDTLNEALKHVPACVHHIVHIIITLQPPKEEFLEAIKTNVKLPPHLRSYSLYFVNPDDLATSKAFENLVSQPIALSIPLIESQMSASCTAHLPPVEQWLKYSATRFDSSPASKKMIMTDNFRARRELRWLKFYDECGSMIVSELSNSAVDAQAWWKKAKKGQHSILRLPFACILETLHLLPPRWNGDYFKLDGSRKPNEPTLRIASPATEKTTVTFRLATSPTTQIEIKIIDLLNKIKLGHLVRFGHSTTKLDSYDYLENDAITDLWENVFDLCNENRFKYLECDIAVICNMSVVDLLARRSILGLDDEFFAKFGLDEKEVKSIAKSNNESLETAEDAELANTLHQYKQGSTERADKEKEHQAFKDARTNNRATLIKESLSKMKDEIVGSLQKIATIIKKQ